jgi:flagellar P-ring protein FlgI
MKKKWFILLVCAAAVAASQSAHAVKIADITRLGGQRSNLLTGFGLVTGLNGNGDGGDFLPAIRPLAALLAKFSDSSTVRDLTNAKNVAIVMVTATVGQNGARQGDRLDVRVTSLGAAKSLEGGYLFTTPMQGPLPAATPGQFQLLALAEGPIVLENPRFSNHAVVKGGAVMEEDLPTFAIDRGHITLILKDPDASWTTASTIAKIINEAEGTAGETLAVAIDSKSVMVAIPTNERERPDSFISRVQRLPVPLLPTEARVEINDGTGTITMSGDVEISPVVISHKGLTITMVAPAPAPTPRNPVITEKSTIGLDTTKEGGAKLQELVEALDSMKVPVEDRITIIKELYRIGKLHAKLIINGQEQ